MPSQTHKILFSLILSGVLVLPVSIAKAALPKPSSKSIATTPLFINPAIFTQQTTQGSTQQPEEGLPPALQLYVDQVIESGKMPKADELKKIPEEYRDEVKKQIELGIFEKNFLQPTQQVTQEPTQQQTQQTPTEEKSFISEYWMQVLGFIISILGIILAVTGFNLAASAKKKSMSKFMNEIDDAFSSFKWKSKRCEAELYRLHDLIEEELKKGKIDESTYGLLTNRIDKYLKEIQEVENYKVSADKMTAAQTPKPTESTLETKKTQTSENQDQLLESDKSPEA